MTLPPLHPKPRSCAEAFRDGGRPLPFFLLDFWRWSVSDLVSNATRGRLAEFIVARALGISTDGVRDEWGAYDLITKDGLKIEVKSAAYLQSWHQAKPSRIIFNIPPTKEWSAKTNQQSTDKKRQADIYVFALLDHQNKETIDPLDLSQWRFYVLSTVTINARTRSQHSITLKTLEELAGNSVSFNGLVKAVQQVL